MTPCSVIGCLSPIKARKLCNKHYELLMKYGDPLIRVRRERGSGTFTNRGRHYFGGHTAAFAHVLIAEKALGRKLPPGACVHHIDRNPLNNSHDNLVICPDQKYHSLLHMRMRALAACGNASWRKCKRCGKYDAPDNVRIYGEDIVHPKCNTLHAGKHKRRKRELLIQTGR